jgi:hypothetical protein
VALFGTWNKFNIGNKLSIEFPGNPKTKTILTDYIIHSSKSSHCDFEVHNDKYPQPVFPKSEKESSILFEQSVQKSKERGAYINSKRISLGKLKGIEIRSYFTPNQNIKLIQVERTFFLNYRIYSLRCVFNSKNKMICEKDCLRFFSSLKFDN